MHIWSMASCQQETVTCYRQMIIIYVHTYQINCHSSFFLSKFQKNFFFFRVWLVILSQVMKRRRLPACTNLIQLPFHLVFKWYFFSLLTIIILKRDFTHPYFFSFLQYLYTVPILKKNYGKSEKPKQLKIYLRRS